MRSLFHFPFPAQPPSQQPSHCSQKCAIARILHPCAASAAPQFCFPPPARSPVPRLPDPGPLSPAPRAPAIPRRRPCLTPLPALIAPHHLSTAPLPPAPIGLASSASRPPHAVARIASTPLRAAIRIPLCRHRADSALIAPPSRPSCAAAVLYVLRFAARIAPTVRRHPRHPPHLSPRVAAAPGPWLARTAPHASLFRRMREKGPLPGNIRPKCMLFEIKMATSSPHASISGRNRAIRDTWRANLAAKGPFRVEEPEITHGAKMLPAPPGLSAAAACGPAERALRPAARAWPACRMRPPLSSRLCPPRPAVRPNGLCALLSRFAVRDPPRGPRTDASRYLRAAPIPPAARTHRVQETSGTTQTTQCGHKNRIPKWGPH